MILSTVFLDRDGVINRDSEMYIKSWEEFEFLPGSLRAIKNLSDAGLDIILITNQSVINRKMVKQEELDRIFKNMLQAVSAEGGKIKDIFYCPHSPDEGCECRKPKPGMIYKARDKYSIDLSKTIMIGDSFKDIECAVNAGCGYTALVHTGNGISSEKKLTGAKIAPAYIGNDLFDVSQWILDNLKKHL